MRIARERVLRVLEAPRLPLAPHLDESVLATLLASLTEGVMNAVLARPTVVAEAAAGQKVEEAFEALRTALRDFPRDSATPPPSIPGEWELDMEEWTSWATPVLRRRANPGRADNDALLLLCGFYRLAFMRGPNAADQATRDFINGWFAEFGPDMRAATARVTPADQRKRRTTEWAPYRRDALRKALPAYSTNGQIDDYVWGEYVRIERSGVRL